MESWQRIRPGLRWIYRGAFPVRRYDLLAQLERMNLDARPVPFHDLAGVPTSSSRMAAGLYLRTDFWARFTSGGSYGHTCYVAKELATLDDREWQLERNRWQSQEDQSRRDQLERPLRLLL